MNKFDVAILGAGPGGYVCAIRCAQYGLKTVLIEERDLGGTCLNRGCIPTKSMLHSSELFFNTQTLGKFGIQVGDVTVDFATVAKRRDRTVDQLRNGVASLLKANRVEVVKGHGAITSPTTLAVGKETYKAEHIVLAPGCKPVHPKIEGIDGSNILTTDQALRLDHCPESVVIIGGGVTGLEFASIFASFGKQVAVLKRSPAILPGLDDEETAKLLLRKFKRLKISFRAGVKFKRITGDTDKTVEYEYNGQEEKAEGEIVIVCTGRSPNTDGLGLSEAGVLTQGGYIKVNELFKTNIPNILAIGDATRGWQLAHAASAQGLAAAAICANMPVSYYGGAVPSCIYTNPEIAYVGLSEKQAVKAGKKIRVGRFHVPSNGKALIMGADTGLIKIISDEETGEIYGAQMACPRATDMIAEIAAVMNCEGTIHELASTIHPHPTLSEMIGEAANDALGLCCHALPSE